MSAFKCAYKMYVCVWDIIMKQLDLKKKASMCMNAVSSAQTFKIYDCVAKKNDKWYNLDLFSYLKYIEISTFVLL